MILVAMVLSFVAQTSIPASPAQGPGRTLRLIHVHRVLWGDGGDGVFVNDLLPAV